MRTVVWYEMIAGPEVLDSERFYSVGPVEWPYTLEMIKSTQYLFWWPISMYGMDHDGNVRESPRDRAVIPPWAVKLFGTSSERNKAHRTAVREFYPLFLNALKSFNGLASDSTPGLGLASVPMPAARTIKPTHGCTYAFLTDTLTSTKTYILWPPLSNRGYTEFILPAMQDLALQASESAFEPIRRACFVDQYASQTGGLSWLSFDPFAQGLAQLTHLDLFFRGTVFSALARPSHSSFDALVRHLEAATHLTHLRLRFDPGHAPRYDPKEEETDEEDQEYVWFKMNRYRKVWSMLPHMPELVSLDMACFIFCTPMEQLREFLMKHADTLRYFKLNSVGHYPPSSKEVFDIPGLRLLQVETLFFGRPMDELVDDDSDNDSLCHEPDSHSDGSDLEEEFEEDEDEDMELELKDLERHRRPRVNRRRYYNVDGETDESGSDDDL